MCGIAGFYSKKEIPEERINLTLKMMENRGPDCQDVKFFRNGSQNRTIGLLHSRLSIIDLDPRSNQPLSIGKQTIAFNGEIYNYLELRKKLVKRNIVLKTSSDTEVLLHFYRIYGEKCVEFLEGMWAFAVYDESNKQLFLSRDRFAEKPLYFMENEDGFFFGSEVKFVKLLSGRNPTVNRRHLMRHLNHGYKSLYKTDDTYFEEIKELKYAQNLTVCGQGMGKPKRYWTPRFSIDESMSIRDAIEGTKSMLFDSVEIRLRSDVPLAFCLSGGVDSAGIASIAAKEFNAKITTFSIIDKDERYNEKDNILSTVEDLGCEYHLISAEQNNPLERLRNLIEYHDAPIATISYFVHSMISEAVHQGGFRVSFSGTSADELFTGYYDHFILHLNEMRSEEDYPLYVQDWSEHVGRFVRNPDLKNPNLYNQDPNFRAHVFDASDELKGFFLKSFIEDFVEENFTDSLLRNRMLNELFHEATPVILHEDDLNSMYYSVENRSPYLDRNLLGFANSIPSRHLIQNGYGKYILREALKGTLNEQVRLDRRKKGFNASINSIVKLKDQETRDYLLDPSAEIFEIIDRTQIIPLLDQFPIPNHLSKFIFNFINARIFLELN